MRRTAAAARRKALSNRTVAALKVERDTVFWDRNLTGFGVRVYPTGGKVYIAQTREPTGLKRPRRITIGRHEVLGTDEARQRAALILARIKAGEEPLPLPLATEAKDSPTVADLAARYLEEHVAVRLKPNTQVHVRGVVRRNILPALGKVPVAAVEQSHVIELQKSLSAHPVTANRAVKVLSHMYRLGEGWGLVPEGCNPCRAVEKHPERRRDDARQGGAEPRHPGKHPDPHRCRDDTRLDHRLPARRLRSALPEAADRPGPTPAPAARGRRAPDRAEDREPEPVGAG